MICLKPPGTLAINNMIVSMTGYPEVKIKEAGFEFTPAYAALNNADLSVGRNSDFSLKGRLENYIPYLLKNDTIKGNMSLTFKTCRSYRYHVRDGY